MARHLGWFRLTLPILTRIIAGYPHRTPRGETMELVVLSSDSHGKDGCDRVILAGDRVVVQGVPVLDHSDFASVSVPPGETLNAVSVRIFLEAARELERRLRP